MYKGKWAIEVAEEYPHAIVRGMDLAPCQPTYLPLNCSFYLGDIAHDLDSNRFRDDSIDLVHMRSIRFLFALPLFSDLRCRQVHAGLTEDTWPVVIGNIYKMLKRGTGWVQLGEVSEVSWTQTTVINPSSSTLWQVLI
jgi:hypothetical protein